MSSIGSHEVAFAQRSRVWRCEDVLEALDFGNSLLGMRPASISNMNVTIVNPKLPAARITKDSQ